MRRGAERSGTVTVAAIADRAAHHPAPRRAPGQRRGTLTLTYEVKDDYGVVSAEAQARQAVRNGKPIETRRPPLMPAPQISLALPGGDNRDGEGRTTIDLSTHPWAGARVEMTLVARDEPGRKAKAPRCDVTLPQRPFTKPLAKALVEQRRDLILDPAGRGRILTRAQGADDRARPIHARRARLSRAAHRHDPAAHGADRPGPDGVADLIWEMALQIEDGDISDAEKALRAGAGRPARRARPGRHATRRSQRLTQDLRKAIDQFLREFAEKQLREQQQPNQQRSQHDRNMRMLTPQDLKSMLDRMEEMARNGNTRGCPAHAGELRNLLDNLKTAPRPAPAQTRRSRRWSSSSTSSTR